MLNKKISMFLHKIRLALKIPSHISYRCRYQETRTDIEFLTNVNLKLDFENYPRILGYKKAILKEKIKAFYQNR